MHVERAYARGRADLRWACCWRLDRGWCWPLRPPQGGDATLETRQADEQWSPAGAPGWQSVPDRQPVQSGDRVRMGPAASARLVSFEGAVIDVRTVIPTNGA